MKHPLLCHHRKLNGFFLRREEKKTPREKCNWRGRNVERLEKKSTNNWIKIQLQFIREKILPQNGSGVQWIEYEASGTLNAPAAVA
jgi:hypothetical protein